MDKTLIFCLVMAIINEKNNIYLKIMRETGVAVPRNTTDINSTVRILGI